MILMCKENKNNDFIQQFLLVNSSCECASKTDIDENKIVDMDYFNNLLTTFLGLESVTCAAVFAGSESSRISSKIS